MRLASMLSVSVLLVCASAGGAVADDAEDCAYKSGDVAIAACTRAIRSGRYRGHALAVKYANRGSEWSTKHDYDRALADYAEALRLDPNYADVHYDRCVAYNRKEDYDGALAACNQAITLGPSAHALNATGDTRLSADRSQSDYFEQRGLARYGKKDLDGAITDYTEALRLYSRNSGALKVRAQAYLDKGDAARANADTEAAQQLAK